MLRYFKVDKKPLQNLWIGARASFAYILLRTVSYQIVFMMSQSVEWANIFSDFLSAFMMITYLVYNQVAIYDLLYKEPDETQH